MDTDNENFMQALADIYAAFPDLSDGGFSGYGSWTTAGYTHAIASMAKTQPATEAVFASLLARLQSRSRNGTSLVVNVAYYALPDYASYYSAFSGIEPPVGVLAALSSRLLDRSALQSDRTRSSTRYA